MPSTVDFVGAPHFWIDNESNVPNPLVYITLLIPCHFIVYILSETVKNIHM